MKKQARDYYTKEKEEEIIRWILSGKKYYKDNIEYMGDWIYLSIYLPD